MMQTDKIDEAVVAERVVFTDTFAVYLFGLPHGFVQPTRADAEQAASVLRKLIRGLFECPSTDLARAEGYRAGLEAAAGVCEDVNVACDHERHNGDPGAAAMAAVLEYRDAIRALAAEPTP